MTTSEEDVIQMNIRPEVMRFAEAMEQVLRDNDHKTGWDELSTGELIKRRRQEYGELTTHHNFTNFFLDNDDFVSMIEQEKRVINESIDIANYCMFLYHNTKRKWNL